ncbi:MAG: FtsX-like permease family protein [Candidatus Cloacimonetes bacterium]|nr:FtsX-like permease family protein [Candidatus Cloacimonadota bacterium]
MILKLAFRNIVGNGWRSLINMVILAIVIIGMIWMQAMYFSWFNLAENQMREWEIGNGRYQQKDYDRFDAFSWEKSHSEIPSVLQKMISQLQAVPILISPAVIYPHGRMMSAVISGIPSEQTFLKIPTSVLIDADSPYVPAVIGKLMAKNSRLQKGDVFTVRLKNINGAYNAIDLEIVFIMDSPVASIDTGKIWIDLANLESIKGTSNSATQIVVDNQPENFSAENWIFFTPNQLMADLHAIKKTETGQQYILFALLLFLGMIAIFDTQVLALFKRRKEIGTLNALGMTPKGIIAIFTTEGILYMIFSIFFAFIFGFPLFWYYAVYGYSMPEGFDEFGFTGMNEPILFSYPAHIILGTLFFVFILTAFVSWLPTASISKMKPVETLRGKVR